MSNFRIPHGQRIVWRSYITKNGKRIYAKSYGKRAFPILVDE